MSKFRPYIKWISLLLLLAGALLKYSYRDLDVALDTQRILDSRIEQLRQHLASTKYIDDIRSWYLQSGPTSYMDIRDLDHFGNGLDQYFLTDDHKILFWTTEAAYPDPIPKLLASDLSTFLLDDDVLYYVEGKQLEEQIGAASYVFIKTPIAALPGHAYAKSQDLEIRSDAKFKIKDFYGKEVPLAACKNSGRFLGFIANILLWTGLLLGFAYGLRLINLRRIAQGKRIGIYFLWYSVFALSAYVLFYRLFALRQHTIWLLAIGAVLLAYFIQGRHKAQRPKIVSDVGSVFVLVCVQLGIILANAYFIYILIRAGILSIDLNRHLLFQPKALIYLTLLMALGLVSTLILSRITASYRPNLKSKWFNLLAAFVSLILFYFIYDYLFSGYALLFISISLCLIILLDLYSDFGHLGFAWLFAWVVLLGLFFAASIYSLRNVVIANKISEDLEYMQDEVFEPLIPAAQIDTLIKKDTQLLQWIRPEFPSKVDALSFKKRFTNLLTGDAASLSESFDFYFYDQRALSLDAQDARKGKYKFTKSFVKKLLELRPDDIHTLRPDGKNIFIKTIFTQNPSHPYSPLVSIITQTDMRTTDIFEYYDCTPYYEGVPIFQPVVSNKLYQQDEKRPNFEILKDTIVFNLAGDLSNTSLVLKRHSFAALRILSLFSMLIVLTFILLFVSSIMALYIKWIPQRFNLFLTNRKSLRFKIQLTILSTIVASFVVIAIITLMYYQSNFEKNNDKNIKATVQRLIQQYDAYELLSKIKYNPQSKDRHIASFETINESILQFYDAEGNMIDPIAKNKKVHPAAFWLLKNPSRDLVLISEPELHFWHFKSKTAFYKVKDPKLKTQGIIQLSPSNSAGSFTRGISDFINTLLNAYVFLFLITGSIAIWLADSITRPIQVLGDNLKNLKLGKEQEPLEWTHQDELGDLIQDYNTTVNKLEESAKLMAITERESAWREMAKQVAHEIKNPLTPMKLSIQHLQMASDRVEDPDVKKMILRVCNTIIEQIDGLANIAGEFSNFAHFPKPKNQSTLLNEVIATAHDLFRKRDDMDIQLYVPIDDIIVFADKNSLLRLFNNLLKNAIQSIPVGRKGTIEIRLYKKEKMAVVEIEDNGCGITEEMYDKVFTPNFTTKSSGTGLGLAISTNIIEALNGRIYFKTKVDVGTVFYVELPLMHKDDNFSNTQRVSLDGL